MILISKIQSNIVELVQVTSIQTGQQRMLFISLYMHTTLICTSKVGLILFTFFSFIECYEHVTDICNRNLQFYYGSQIMSD